MTRKSHLTLRNSKSIENKSNEGQSLQNVPDDDRPKRKKNRSKTNKQEYVGGCKANEMNSQATNSLTRLFKDRVKHNDEWDKGKEKKELKKSAAEIKNGDVNNSSKKLGISLDKNRKPQSEIEVKKSDISVGRKPYVFKKRIIKQSEKQYGERSENNNFISHNDGFNVNIKRDNNDTCKRNRQFKNQNSNEQSEKCVGVTNCIINDNYKTSTFSRRNLFKSQNVTQKTFDNNIKHNSDIKTMSINRRRTTYTKSNSEIKCQYGEKPKHSYKRPDVITNNLDKYVCDFYSRSGKNTCSINSTNSASNEVENSMRNKRSIKNVEPIVKSSEKNKYEKSFVGSEYGGQKIANDLQTFGSDIIEDINLNPLSPDLTFIHAKQDKSQDNKQNKIFTVTCKDQNDLKTTNNNHNNPRLSDYEKHKKDFTEKLNKYQNIEREKHNDNIQANSVANYDRFIAHFDKIWEGVIREISGY